MFRSCARHARVRSPLSPASIRSSAGALLYTAPCPAGNALITASGLDWDRTIAGRTSFRGFDGDRLVARVTRVRPGQFVVQVRGATLPRPHTTLSAARAAAAGALFAGAQDAPAALPRAA